MIRKLRTKFIFLAMSSLFVLLLFIIAGMNLLNYNSVAREADEILSIISQNKGIFPDFGENRDGMFPADMSPEIPYESRYFSILLSDSGQVLHAEMSQIIAVDKDTATEYANKIIQSDSSSGFVDNFRYIKTQEENGIRVTFLDCGRKLDIFQNFLIISIIMALSGYLVVFVVISIFSKKFIHPVAESYEKQKRFITDAGHEIKTPLTIINSNVDLLKMDIGDNECLEDIQQQAKRLTALTNDLIYLARMEESENTLQMIEFPVSEIVLEAAMPFKTLAETQQKQFVCNVQPMLSMQGNDKTIQQLVSILMDNAIKYSPSNGVVSLNLVRQNKNLALIVFNTTETFVPSESLHHVFDRFYRTDPSRNSETGGHGIGLSVAKAIVTAHNGQINAQTQDGHSFQITATFPINNHEKGAPPTPWRRAFSYLFGCHPKTICF